MVGGDLSESSGDFALNAGLPLAVVYTAEEASSLVQQKPACRGVLVLTPDALARLSGSGLPLISLTEVLTDRRQAGIVARLRRLDRWVLAQIQGVPMLGTGGASAFRHDLYYLSAFVMGLSVALGRVGPWLVPENGGWVRFDDRQAVLDHFVRTIDVRDGGFRPSIGCPPLSWVVRAVGWLMTVLLSGRAVMVMTCRRYGLPNLAGMAPTHGLVPVEIRAAVGGWRDLAYSLRGWLKVFWGGTREWTVVAVPRRNKRLVDVLDRTWSRLPDPSLRQALEPYRNVVVTEAELTDGCVAHMENVLRRLQVRAVIAHSMRWSSEAALCQAAGQAGIPRLLFSHGSHPDAMSNTAFHPHTILADGLLVSRLADLGVVQSPVAARAAAKFMPAMPTLATRPIMWGYKPAPSATGSRRQPRILHAGTYKRLSGWRPWIYETSLEFVQGLVDLAEAVLQLDEVELVIRVREAPECSIATLRRLLPAHPRIQIKTDGTFLEDLADSDLLVSYASTTIEEALAAQRPVLLWGGSPRYRHLPARLQLPSPHDRDAVYAVDRAEDLPAMVSAILDAHRDKPLRQEETSHLVADCALPDAAEFLSLLRDGQVGRFLIQSGP